MHHDATSQYIDRTITVNAVAGPAVALNLDAVNYLAPATVSLTAMPTATSGTTISKADFYQRASLLGIVSAAPHTNRWTNVGAGVYPVSVTVAVIEEQERGALHFHVAVRGRQNYHLLRSIWQSVLGLGPSR